MLRSRNLLTTGLKVDGKFSLSYSDEKGSLENGGLVGVRGISSEISEAEVVALAGVLMHDEAGDRVGAIRSNVKG